jgi:hypothetical protein
LRTGKISHKTKQVLMMCKSKKEDCLTEIAGHVNNLIEAGPCFTDQGKKPCALINIADLAAVEPVPAVAAAGARQTTSPHKQYLPATAPPTSFPTAGLGRSAMGSMLAALSEHATALKGAFGFVEDDSQSTVPTAPDFVKAYDEPTLQKLDEEKRAHAHEVAATLANADPSVDDDDFSKSVLAPAPSRAPTALPSALPTQSPSLAPTESREEMGQRADKARRDRAQAKAIAKAKAKFARDAAQAALDRAAKKRLDENSMVAHPVGWKPPTPAPRMAILNVAVPDWASPGDTIPVHLPNDGSASALVPPGAKTGDIIPVPYTVNKLTAAAALATPQQRLFARDAAKAAMARAASRKAAPAFQNVTVPAGAEPGSSLRIVLPDGESMVVVVPAGKKPGAVFAVPWRPVKQKKAAVLTKAALEASEATEAERESDLASWLSSPNTDKLPGDDDIGSGGTPALPP